MITPTLVAVIGGYVAPGLVYGFIRTEVAWSRSSVVVVGRLEGAQNGRHLAGRLRRPIDRKRRRWRCGIDFRIGRKCEQRTPADRPTSRLSRGSSFIRVRSFVSTRAIRLVVGVWSLLSLYPLHFIGSKVIGFFCLKCVCIPNIWSVIVGGIPRRSLLSICTWLIGIIQSLQPTP